MFKVHFVNHDSNLFNFFHSLLQGRYEYDFVFPHLFNNISVITLLSSDIMLYPRRVIRVWSVRAGKLENGVAVVV